MFGRETAFGTLARTPWRRPEMAQIRGRTYSLLQLRALRQRGLDVAWDVEFGETPETRLSFGKGCSVGRGTLLALEKGELTLGDDVLVGAYANIRAVDSFVRIGARVQIAQFVSLIAANHRVDDSGVPLREEHDVRGGHHGVVLGDDCWLGVQVIVLPGVELGARCVVAAGAVVTRSFGAGTTLAGVPARPITR